MKLSDKLLRLASRRGWISAGHALHRWTHPISARAIEAGIDATQFRSIQDRHAVPGEQVEHPKYLNVNRFLGMNIRRAQDLRLNRSAPLRIFDLGSGAGWFLLVSRHLGHGGLGLDRPEPAMYGEMFDLFGLERVESPIRPFTPLPDVGRRFDLVTAFSVCFNGPNSPELWGPPEWEFLLDDLEARFLAGPGSRIYLDLNPQRDGTPYTPELRDFFLKRGAQIDRSKILLQRSLR